MTPGGPFDTHPTVPAVLEAQAESFVRLAAEAGDHDAVTGRAFAPAVASWDGVAAPELRAAPEPVRAEAEQVASSVAWAAVPLAAWAGYVRTFNDTVDDLRQRLALVPAEVERHLRQVYAEPWEAWPQWELDNARLAKRRELTHALEQEWHLAADALDEGERTVVGMLRRGPDWDNLAVARELGALPAGAFAGFVAAQWERSAALAEAARIVALVADQGETPSLAELERLGDILAEHAEDPLFAYALLTSLGPEGLLELTAGVGLLAGDPAAAPWAEGMGAVQTGLATALATATRRGSGALDHTPYGDPGHPLGPGWTAELVAAGRQLLLVGGQPPSQLYGYQALGVLLSNGGFDDQFLAEVGGAMIDFERERGGSAVWTDGVPGHGAQGMRLNWIHGTGDAHPAGFDPVIGLLRALAESPEAAREVLAATEQFIVPVDPDLPDGSQHEITRLARLGYLLTDREWPPDVVADAGWLADPSGLPMSPGIATFGRVLELATIVDPDERSYRIVEGIISEIAHDEQVAGYPNDPTGQGAKVGVRAETFHEVDLIHDTLRPSVARIADAYIQDLHWIINDFTDATSEALDHNSVRLTGVDRNDLRFTLADLGKNAEARGIVAAAQYEYAAELYGYYLDGWDGESPGQAMKTASVVTRPTALVIAALDYGAASELHRGFAAEDAAHNAALRSQFFWAGAVVSAGSDLAPAGNSVNYVGQTVLDEIERQLQADRTGEANYYQGSLRDMSRDILTDMVRVAVYEQVTAALTPDELLARVPPDDRRELAPLFHGGEFVPMEEWADEHRQAWDIYLSRHGDGVETVLGGTAEDSYDDKFARYRDDLAGERRVR